MKYQSLMSSSSKDITQTHTPMQNKNNMPFGSSIQGIKTPQDLMYSSYLKL